MGFPIDIQRIKFEQQGRFAEKFYELTLLVEQTSKTAVMMRRFGKVNSRGQMICETFQSADVARTEMAKYYGQAILRNYSLAQKDDFTVVNATEMRSRLGPVIWIDLPGKLFEHLDIEYDKTKRRHELPELEGDTFGNSRLLEKPKLLSPEEVQADLRRQEEERAAREAELQRIELERRERVYSANPNFGRF